jgi:hypothetical protein
MIDIVLLRQLRNSEFIRYHKDVLTICNAASPATLGIAEQVTALQTAVSPMDELFVKERGSLVTPELEALDERRDNALNGIKAAAEAYTYHYETALSGAGKQIISVFNRYGSNLAKLNYLAETEVIVSLADELANDGDLNTAMRTLRLEGWLQELATANQQFNSRFLNRNSEYAAQPVGNLLEKREAAIEAYRQLAAHIAAHATLTPSEVWSKLVAEINSLAASYNEVVTSRKSSVTSNDAGTENPPQQTE